MNAKRSAALQIFRTFRDTVAEWRKRTYAEVERISKPDSKRSRSKRMVSKVARCQYWYSNWKGKCNCGCGLRRAGGDSKGKGTEV